MSPPHNNAMEKQGANSADIIEGSRECEDQLMHSLVKFDRLLEGRVRSQGLRVLGVCLDEATEEGICSRLLLFNRGD